MLSTRGVTCTGDLAQVSQTPSLSFLLSSALDIRGVFSPGEASAPEAAAGPCAPPSFVPGSRWHMQFHIPWPFYGSK